MRKREIMFGGQKIFLSDIENYGTSQKCTYFETVYKEKSWKTGLFGHYKYSYTVDRVVEIDRERYEECKSGSTTYILVDCGDGVRKSYVGRQYVNPGKGVYYKKESYLYVATYNKTYTFWANCVNFSIYQKCKEINAALATSGYSS